MACASRRHCGQVADTGPAGLQARLPAADSPAWLAPSPPRLQTHLSTPAALGRLPLAITQRGPKSESRRGPSLLPGLSVQPLRPEPWRRPRFLSPPPPPADLSTHEHEHCFSLQTHPRPRAQGPIPAGSSRLPPPPPRPLLSAVRVTPSQPTSAHAAPPLDPPAVRRTPGPIPSLTVTPRPPSPPPSSPPRPPRCCLHMGRLGELSSVSALLQPLPPKAASAGRIPAPPNGRTAAPCAVSGVSPRLTFPHSHVPA